MFHFSAYLVFVLFAAMSSFAGTSDSDAKTSVLRKIEDRPFDVGEELIFSLDYGPVRAGTGALKVLGIEEINGKKCYHVVSEAKSSNFFSYFFKVDDRMDSYIDVDGIFSRKFEKRIREGKYHSDQVIVYDQEKNLAFFKGDTLKISPFVQDALSVFYYVRTQDLEVGKPIIVDSFTDGKLYPLKIEVLGVQDVEVEAGRFECFVIEPSFRGSSVFGQKGKLKIWITNDRRKMIVLMKSKVPFGSIYAKLAKYKVKGKE